MGERRVNPDRLVTGRDVMEVYRRAIMSHGPPHLAYDAGWPGGVNLMPHMERALFDAFRLGYEVGRARTRATAPTEPPDAH